MNTPVISVVLPVYNGSRFLKQTIDSVLLQTFTDFEFIIVDDASTDNSRCIIDSYNDSRIQRIYLTQNLNICHGSNLAFSKASGKYIALIGHDDVWHPDKLQKQLTYMEAHAECGVCFTRCNMINHENQLLNIDYFNTLENNNRFQLLEFLFYNNNHLCAPTAFIRTSTLKAVGYYDYSLLFLQDYELWLRILTKQDLYILNENLTDYRQISDTESNLSNITEATRPRMYHETIYLQEKLLFHMDDACFAEAFRKHFVNPEASGEILLTCEKIWILKELNNPYYIQHLMQVINDPEYRLTLENTYHITLQDFYKINTEPVFCEPTMTDTLEFYHAQLHNYEQIATKQQALLERQADIIEQLEKK